MRSGFRVQGTADRNPSGTGRERTRFPAHNAQTGHLRILPPMRAGDRKDGGPRKKPPDVPPTVTGKVILVGNPNVGKSVIFGHLTGRYVTVSNYPGTTVEVSRGQTRERGKSLEVIDTPGVYSLLPMSEDERVTRDILMREPGAIVLQVCDAKNMSRSLLFTTQLPAVGGPLVLDVNMADEARNRGVMPKLEGLEETFGVPAVPTVAIRKKGVDRIRPLLTNASPSFFRLDYGRSIEDSLSRIERLLPDATPVGKR